MKEERFEDFTVQQLDDGMVRVFLPHQCDDWDIAGYDEGRPVGIPREHAITQLEEFLAAGKDALELLKSAEAEDIRTRLPFPI
jgi:hypothetical protein